MSTLEDRMTECADFLDAIWGTEDRGLYTIVVAQENPDGAGAGADIWHTYAFRWPKGRQKAVERIFRADEDAANVYICPALFNAPKRLREHVAGSHCLWMDSDGNAPMTFDAAVPVPSLRIRTSSPTNIHDYWLLDEFLDDIDALETGNRSITAYFGTDQSGWDATQLLRPPGTTNRKNGLPVRRIS